MNNKLDEMAKVGLAAVALAFGLAIKTEAAGPTYTTVDFPGAVATLAVDINDSGQIVGEYTFTTVDKRHGFLLNNGTFTSITFPGASFTRAIGINRNGDIVGDYILQGVGFGNEHGYLLRGGVFTSISFPNADATIAEGINANGDIVGTYVDKQGKHGFLLHGGTFTSIDFPGADAYTEAWRISDGGQIAGRYEGGESKYHVYTLSNGNFNPVPDVPGAVQTVPGNFSDAGGLNNFGDIAGNYSSSEPANLGTAGDLHGFLLSGGAYTAINFPGAASTLAFGLNGSGVVVGVYTDASGFHGYLRSP